MSSLHPIYYQLVCPMNKRKFSLDLKVKKSVVKYRNSLSQMFFKIGALKISQYSQENTCVGVSF